MPLMLPLLWKLGKRLMSHRLPCSLVILLVLMSFDVWMFNLFLLPFVRSLQAPLVGNLFFVHQRLRNKGNKASKQTEK